MVELATTRTGRHALLLRFEDVSFAEEFDGIWACASLLHVPLAKLPAAFCRLVLAAKGGGAIYASFKYGSGKRTEDGRTFTDMTEGLLQCILGSMGGFDIVRMWRSPDARRGRSNEVWLNLLGRIR